ncbi:MAG: ATP-dependent nuclease [Mycoplasmoidaceae bacterium]
MAFEIKFKNDKIKLENDKGAIIIGPNGSGKSKIINTIYENAKDETISIITENKDQKDDGEKYKIIKIDASSFLKKNFETKNSNFNQYLEGIRDKCKNDFNEYYQEIDKETIEKCNEQLKENEENSNYKWKIFQICHECEKYEHNPTIKTIVKFGGREYNLESCSTGLKTLISLLINGIENGEKNLYLFDEIDAFLHPEWISLISKMIDKVLEKENKIILVTHNPLFLTKLIKNNLEMISIIRWNEDKDYGSIYTLNWKEIIEKQMENSKLKAELLDKASNEKSREEKYNKNYIKEYIINTLSADICRLFFDKKLLFVEGFTEQVYFNYKDYNYSVIQTGGFHQFPLMNFIVKEIKKVYKDINDKYIMDKDKNEYNEEVFKLLNKKAHRLDGQFEELYLGTEGKDVKKSREKTEKILNFVSLKNKKEKNKNQLKKLEKFLGVSDGK